MASSDLIIRVLADTGDAATNVNNLISSLGKLAGVGVGAGVAGGIVEASMKVQDAMARVQTAYNSADFAPGTAKFQAAQNSIQQFSETTATSFADAATVYAQGVRFIDDAGKRLDPSQLDAYTETMLKLSKISTDQLSPEGIGQQVDILAKLFGTSDFSTLGAEIAKLSTMHNQGEGPGLDAAIAIGQVGADIGVSQQQSLALGNYLADLGLGGQMGGSSVGRILQRTGNGIDQLDPEQAYKDLKAQRDAGEKLDDLQNQLAVAEKRRASMYGQHGLKTAYKRDPAAVMAADNEIAKLQREISDTQQDNEHLTPSKSGSTSAANISAMAGLLGIAPGDFASQFQNDPISALLQWTHALGQLPESERLSAMTKAFGTRGGAVNVRDQKIIEALANPDRQATLQSYLDAANGQASAPTALNTLAEIPLSTTSSKVTDVSNAAFGAAAAAGNGPREAIDGLTQKVLDNTTAVDKLDQTLAGNGLLGTITTGVISGVSAAVPIVIGTVLARGVAGVAGARGVAGVAGGISAGTAIAGGAGAALLAALGMSAGAVKLGLDNPALTNYVAQGDSAYTNGSKMPSQITVNVGDVHAHTLQDVLDAVKAQLTAAWTAASASHPVSGQVGGNFVSGQGPR